MEPSGAYCYIFRQDQRDARRCGTRYKEEDNADGQSRYSRDQESCRSPSQGARKSRRREGSARAQARSAKAAKDHPIRDQLAATRDTIKSEASKKASALKGDAATLANQASVKARDAATKGKDKAAEAVGSLAKMLEDSAGTVDTKCRQAIWRLRPLGRRDRCWTSRPRSTQKISTSSLRSTQGSGQARIRRFRSAPRR